MQVDEALALVDTLLPHRPLNNLQETILSQVWEGKTYAEIAADCCYEHNYIRDVGFRLWHTLSGVLGQKISKSNVKAALGRYARSREGDQPSRPQVSLVRDLNGASNRFLEIPYGPVPLGSRLYIERPPIEAQTFADVLKTGSLIRLKAPQQMGKTSLLWRILAHAEQHHLQTITLRFNRGDRNIYQNLDIFLHWFCANISRQLGIQANLAAYWNSDLGSKMSCSTYLEEYVLEHVTGDIVIALDELNDLFQYPEIATEFLPLLWSWYEEGREFSAWQRVHWVITQTTDGDTPLQLQQSPFNAGLSIKLPPFTLEQVQELADRQGLSWLAGDRGTGKLLSLLQMVSSRPGLIRPALYALARNTLTLEQLIDEAPTQSGIYSDHLRELLAALYPYPELQAAFRKVVSTAEPVTLQPMAASRLEGLGLISLSKNQALPSCDLYRHYFRNFLPAEPSLVPV